MSSRRSLVPLAVPLRRSSTPHPEVSSPVGRRAGALSLGLILLGALGSGWCLISTGRALGALLVSSQASGLLTQALAAAVLSAVCQLLAQWIARSSALSEEAHLRRLTLAHLLGLGPARAADVRSGATASLLTDGAERVALYRQTFLAPTLAAAAAPLLVLVELALTVDMVPALVLALAVVVVPAFIAFAHSRLRTSSSDSRRARTRRRDDRFGRAHRACLAGHRCRRTECADRGGAVTDDDPVSRVMRQERMHHRSDCPFALRWHGLTPQTRVRRTLPNASVLPQNSDLGSNPREDHCRES